MPLKIPYIDTSSNGKTNHEGIKKGFPIREKESGIFFKNHMLMVKKIAYLLIIQEFRKKPRCRLKIIIMPIIYLNVIGSIMKYHKQKLLEYQIL